MKRVLFIMSLVLLASCTTVKYVPVDKVHTEYVTQLKTDSIYVHDSIDVKISGDTIYKDRWHTRYRVVYSSDTVRLTDTIPVIQEVEVQKITNKLNGPQNFLCWSGGILWAILLIVVIVIIIKKFVL